MTHAAISRPTVLVAEDNAMIRKIVCEVLEESPFDVLGVESTQSAIRTLDGDVRIVAAFLDLDLGDRGGGYIVARHGRLTRPDMAVIYTSGGGQTTYARDRVEGSVFVPKPYLPSQVREMIEAVVRRAEAQLH